MCRCGLSLGKGKHLHVLMVCVSVYLDLVRGHRRRVLSVFFFIKYRFGIMVCPVYIHTIYYKPCLSGKLRQSLCKIFSLPYLKEP